MKKAVIFDIDGTMWDACQQISDSWNEYVVRYAPGVKPGASPQLIRSLCGQPMDRFAQAVFPDLPEDRQAEITEKCCEYEVTYLASHAGDVYPGLQETLKQLKEKGYHLYIVSNCQTGYIEAFMEATGTQELFEDHECYGRTLRQKGENIRLLYERNGLDRAVYLGDTMGDYQASSYARVPFIYASYGFGTLDEGVNAPSIQCLPQLPMVVEEHIIAKG